MARRLSGVVHLMTGTKNEVLPEPSGDDKVKFEIPNVNSSYEVIADKPLESGASQGYL